MGEINRILARILKRAGLGDPPATPTDEQWRDLLDRLGRAFIDAEEDRYTLERSLSVSSQELQTLNEQRTRFLLSTSYELRNPLTLIFSGLSTLAKKNQSPDPEILPALALSAKRILLNLGTLLDFSQIDLGYLQLRYSQGNLGRILQDLITASTPYARERAIEYQTVGLDQLPDSIFDCRKIEAILGQVLFNSLRYCPSQGKISVHAQTTHTQIIFLISDHRVAISPEQAKRQFDRQAQDFQSDGGFGLSLVLAHELAQFLGGSLLAKADEKMGSVFRLEIPREPKNLDPEAVMAPPADIVSSLPDYLSIDAAQKSSRVAEEISAINGRVKQNLRRKRPLLFYIESDPPLALAMAKLFADDFDFFLVTDTLGISEKFESYHPDLVMSETQVGEKSGLNICAELRSHASLNSTPFIFLTADPTLQVKVRALETGADDYLCKPFSPDELRGRILNLLRSREPLRVFRHGLEGAKRVQRLLLPADLNVSEGYELGCLFSPLEELSGDFYDYFLVEDWLYFYIADVTGHGLVSAQATYLVKQIVQGELGSGEAIPLSDLLEKIAKLYGVYETDLDVALLLGRFHPGQKTFEFIRAGVPAPVSVRQGKAYFIGGASGPALSRLDPKISFSTEYYPIASHRSISGELVFFFSDGLSEFGTAEKRVSPDKVLTVLETLSDADWKTKLFLNLQTTVGSMNPDDDLTLLRFKL